MKAEDRLDKNTRDKLNEIRFFNKDKQKSKKNKENKLSYSEIEELMAVNRPTYKRCNRAFRQK